MPTDAPSTPRLRLATPDDDAELLAVYAPYVRETAITFETAVPDRRQFRERIATTLERAPWLLVEERGSVLGFAYAIPYRPRAAYRWCVESTVYIGSQHQHRGLGRALYTSLFAILELQGFCTLLAGIALPNEASVRLHESFGLRRVGVLPNVGHKLGRWHDVGFWARSLRPHPASPQEPRLLAALTGGELAHALEAGERQLRPEPA